MFADNLKRLRTEKGFTQIEFARNMNVATGTVGNWETGKREPDINTIKKIANMLKVSVSQLVEDSDENNDIEDFQFALYGETKELSEGQKQDILNFIRFIKSQEEKKGK